MFTGIITHVGKIKKIQSQRIGRRVFIETELTEKLSTGDSVSVDGVCLTVEERTRGGFWVYLSKETLSVSKFGRVLRAGYRVNLEPPLSLQRPIGGHLVTGHVDCMGKIRRITPLADSASWEVEVLAPEYKKYLLDKGSVALDGVSLTIKKVTLFGFEVELVPHTLTHTNFLDRKVGELVNLEFDLLGKYVEHFINMRRMGSGTI